MVGRNILKFLISSAAVIVLCAISTQTASAALGPNLISNPSLEQGSYEPTGWTGVLDGAGNVATFKYPAAAYDGSRGARINVTTYKGTGDIFWLPPASTVTAGKQYQFKSYFRANVPTVFLATYIKSNGATSYAVLASAPASNTNNAWMSYTKTLTIPAGVTSIKIQQIVRAVGFLEVDAFSLQEVISDTPASPTLSVSAPAANQNYAAGSSLPITWQSSHAPTGAGVAMWLVNAQNNANMGVISSQSPASGSMNYTLPGSLAPGTYKVLVHLYTSTGTLLTTANSAVFNVTTSTPPPPTNGNLVKNGNLETASTNTAIPADWNTNYWGTLTPTFTYPVAGKDGGKAARVTVANYQVGDAKWWFTHVPASSNTLYQYSNNYTATAITNLTVEFKMSNGTYQYQWLGDVPAQSGWGTYATQITVPTGAVSFTVFHALQANGSLTIDNVSVTALPANPFPSGMVTFVFDDAFATQFANARPILNTAGIKGVFAVITQYAGTAPYASWSNITTLKNEGHEIAGHSRTHAGLTALSSTQLQSETKGAYDDLVAQGITPKTFVYPYGATNTVVKQAIKDAGYIGARGSYFGLNAPISDKYALYDIRLDRTSTLAQVKTLIDQAAADKRWIVFEIHEVRSSGGDDYTITPSFLQSVVDYVKQKGVNVVTLQQGVGLMN